MPPAPGDPVAAGGRSDRPGRGSPPRAAWCRAPHRADRVPSAHLSIALPPGEQVTTVAGDLARRQDDRVYRRPRSTSRLYLRALDYLRGTRGGRAATARSIRSFRPTAVVAFFAGGKLWRAPVAGGARKRSLPPTRPGAAAGAPTDHRLRARRWATGCGACRPRRRDPEQLTKPTAGRTGTHTCFPQALPGRRHPVLVLGPDVLCAALPPASGTGAQVTPAQAQQRRRRHHRVCRERAPAGWRWRHAG